MSLNLDNGTTIQHGEENIYSLINKDTISGAIMLMGNAANPELIETYSENDLLKNEIPVISIDSQLDFCECIIAEDEQLMEMMTDHFIEHHNCKKIICLTGFEGMPVSESRLSGYRKSLDKAWY